MNEITTKLGDKWRSEVGGLYQVIKVKYDHFYKADVFRIKLICVDKTYGDLSYWTTQQTLNRRFQKQTGSI